MKNAKEIRWIYGDPEKGPRVNVSRELCAKFKVKYGTVAYRNKYHTLYPIVKQITTKDGIKYSEFPRQLCLNNKHRNHVIDKAIEIFGRKGSNHISCQFVVEDNRKLTANGIKLQRNKFDKIGWRVQHTNEHFKDEVLHTGTVIGYNDPVKKLGIPRTVYIDGNYINGVKVMNSNNDILKRRYKRIVKHLWEDGMRLGSLRLRTSLGKDLLSSMLRT